MQAELHRRKGSFSYLGLHLLPHSRANSASAAKNTTEYYITDARIGNRSITKRRAYD